MNISEIAHKIDIKNPQNFIDYTKKWISFVTSKKLSSDISDSDWQTFFGPKNPAAGIDWGALKDEIKDRYKRIKNTNEQKSFRDNWNHIIRPTIEEAINIKDDSEKIKKIKELDILIHKVIEDGGGRNVTTAINRMLTVFFPDYFVTIPQSDKLLEFVDLLRRYIANGKTIRKADNWIDNSFQVKRFLANELKDDYLTASSWRFYDYLKKNKPITTTTKDKNIKTTAMGVTTEYDEYKKLLVGNYNLILTGAPGTGKTFLAKKIAKAMGADEGSIKMVQFHPSYDYTDFVEGLRSIKEGNSLGFQRKDGVFKDFCKKAIKNTWTIDTAYSELIHSIKVGTIKTLSTRTKATAELKVKGDDNIYWYSEGEKSNISSNCISRERLIKLYTHFDTIEKFESMNNVQDGIKSVIGGCDATYYWAVLNYILSNKSEAKPYVFIIDEINRGEISKIFGELFYSIDPGYRGEKGKVETQYQNLIPKEGDPDFDPINPDVFRNGFYIPQNVYIIGTMNDIDRSVESMDFAMRRRFAWKEISAKSRQSMLDKDDAWKPYGKPSPDIISEMKARMDNLNAAIVDQYGTETHSNKDKIGLSKAYQIGAAYFLKYALYNDFEELWTNHLEGLLREYLRGKTNVDEKIERLYQAYNDTTAH